MHISFFPTLGSRTRVPVEPSIKQNAGGVRAAFTARLSADDYAEAVRTGVRIEVWTNAPSGGRSAGEWGAIAFEEVDDAADADAEERPEVRLSLDADVQSKLPSPVEVNASKTHVFRAALVLPRTPGWVFAFTYRLIYPSGICWLGSDRDNGMLELDTDNAFFEENGFWQTREGRRVLVDEHDSKQPADGEEYTVVGKLDVNEWTWAGWATDGSRVWPLNDNSLELTQEARLAYLIPTAPKGSVLLPQTHIFRATSESTPFSITSQGHVVLRSCGQGAAIDYRVHDCNSEGDFELIRSEIFSSCSAPQIFYTKDTDMVLFTPNCDSDTSVTIYVQALTCIPTPQRSISVPITALDSFAKHSTVLSLFIPETRNTLFVDRSEHSGDLSLMYGSSGAQVVVSAVYDLTVASIPYPAWQFSLLAGNVQPEYIPASKFLENPLPTPPASPQAKPQRTVSFVLPFESDAESGLRQRKPVEPSSPAQEKRSAARRLLSSDSAFEHFQSASGGERVKVVIVNVLKMLARFMGVAVLRFILIASRLIGGARQPEVQFPHAGINSDRDSAAPPLLLQEDSKPAGEAGSKAASSGSEEADAIPTVEKETVETPPIQYRGALSTETVNSDLGQDRHQERSMHRTSAFGSASPALKWILPAGDATPITLLVRSDAAPEEVSKHLCIELDGEPVEVTGLSVVSGVGDKTSIVEIARPQGAFALLVKLTD